MLLMLGSRGTWVLASQTVLPSAPSTCLTLQVTQLVCLHRPWLHAARGRAELPSKAGLLAAGPGWGSKLLQIPALACQAAVNLHHSSVF